MKFAIIVSKFNAHITEGLLVGAVDYLNEQKVTKENIDVFSAPGAFEAPLIAKKLALTGRYKGVICLGAVIKGDTAHFEFVSLGAATGVMQAMLETEVPIAFGVITTYNMEQATARAKKDSMNKGREAATACFETVQTLERLDSPTRN